MILLGLTVLGMILGSFVNAFIWRLHEQSKFYDDEGVQKKLTQKDRKRLNELSIAKGRSMCSRCGHRLSALDLIPVLSWVMLRGRCRYCNEKIADTPLIEISLPLLLVLSYVFWPYGLVTSVDYAIFAIWILMMTCFVALAAYDWKWYLLPDKIVLPLTLLACLFVLLRASQLEDWAYFIQPVFSALLFSGIFLLMYVYSKGAWIGFGDVKLAVSLGLIVGTPLLVLLALFISSLSGTVAAIPQLISAPSKSRKTIPFGPHLLLATVVVFLFGTALSNWYLNGFIS